MNEDRSGKSGEVLFEFRQLGAQMRVSAIDADDQHRSRRDHPRDGHPLQMQSLALAKLKAKLAEGQGAPAATPAQPQFRGKYALQSREFRAGNLGLTGCGRCPGG